MRCLECSKAGGSAQAVGVCLSCGAGLCSHHLGDMGEGPGTHPTCRHATVEVSRERADLLAERGAPLPR